MFEPSPDSDAAGWYAVVWVPREGEPEIQGYSYLDPLLQVSDLLDAMDVVAQAAGRAKGEADMARKTHGRPTRVVP